MVTIRTPDLAQIERRAYETVWQDGLIDVFVGLALFLMGILWVTQDSGYGAFVAPLVIPLWVVARSHISEPRVGVVRLGPERIRQENGKLFGLFLFGVLAMLASVAWYVFGPQSAANTSDWASKLVAGLPAALLAVPALIVAIVFGTRRFVAYATALLLSGMCVVFWDLQPGWAFISSGIFCLVVGGNLLLRFIRKYPLDR